MTFAQRLAHPDRKTRDANLRALSSFIQRRAPLSPIDVQKLWKGLFYSFWLSDKPLVQLDLARRISLMQTHLTPARWSDWLHGFYTTMKREWNGIDRLRVDKFLSLVRLTLHHSLRFIAVNHRWEEAVVQRWVNLYNALPLHPGIDQRGLFLHLADIFVPELTKVVEEAGPPPFPILRQLLLPFLVILADPPSPSMARRVETELLSPLLTLCSSSCADSSRLHSALTTQRPQLIDLLTTLAADRSAPSHSRIQHTSPPYAVYDECVARQSEGCYRIPTVDGKRSA